MDSTCGGFAPVARSDATLLILGSLPGRRSLERSEYYAHPRNAFWPIMAELYGACGSYSRRCAALVRGRVALWDVLAAANRHGSLDASIRKEHMTINDFEGFFEVHSAIDTVAFNGREASALFRRHVLARPGRQPLRLLDLPSTSPAHAALTQQQKLAVWRSILTDESNSG